jgi:dTDP-3-amino-3,4,6-trideoxy-alpha-D-glucose transaminase
MNDFRTLWDQERDRVLAAVDRVGASGWYILGQEVVQFEAALAERWGIAHAVGCGNGLDAIEVALRALGLKPGDKVLTTPLSAFATSLAIIRAGGVPVFVDVDNCGQLDLELVEAQLHGDPAIRFLVPVHLYGFPLDLARLDTLKSRFGVKIVEDCAQAIGAKSGGRRVGTVGDAAATSFYPTKNLGALGDGGAVLTASAPVAARARHLRDYGQTGKYVHDELGLNSRLDEMHAAILRDAFLPRLEEFTLRRRAIAQRYLNEIRSSDLTLLALPRDAEPVWHLFPVLVKGAREHLQAHLADSGIASGIHYPKLIPSQGALAALGTPTVRSGLVRAQMFADHELSLPIHPFLTEAEVGRVIEACDTWRG